MTPRWQKLIKEYSEALLIAIILALIIKAFFIQAFKIPSGSMLETLQIGDHLLVSKIVYGVKIPFTNNFVVTFEDPQHKDIIVFEYPEDPSKDYIKRIIGVPGDVIEIKNKEVFRNDEKLDEPYVQHTKPGMQKGTNRDNLAPLTVPEGKYFVMGDNRDESYDSRFWGFVDHGQIKGKAWILYWSWQNFKVRWGRIGQTVE